MRKILLTISRGWIARNLLHNEFYKILRENCELIIITTAADSDRFIGEFSHPNVRFIAMDEKGHNSLDALIFFFHKNLIYNSTVDQKNRWGIIGDPKSRKPIFFFYLIKKIIFIPLSKMKFLRELFRLVDYFFLQKNEVNKYLKVLDREKPDLVLSTNVYSDSEAALIKAARKRKIFTLGIPKSWDNSNKNGLRAKTDVMFVWSEFMADEVIKYQNYKDKKVKILGIPQFDDYTDKNLIMNRKEFCEIYELDPGRRIIFFGSEGKLLPTDAEIADIIYEDILTNKFNEPSQLLVRPHFGYKDDDLKFKSLFGRDRVVVDRLNNPSDCFRDSWDYSSEFTKRFVNCLYHSDVIVSTYSTLTLDGAAFDKPLINIAFDGRKFVPYDRSVARWEMATYFKKVLNTGAVWNVNNVSELRNAINSYLDNPSKLSKERELLRARFCFKIDGQSGKRFANEVLNLLRASS